MLNVTKKYIEACESPTRSSYIVAKYGLFDKEAKTRIIATLSVSQPFSNAKETYNEIKENPYKYISNEPNRVTLDGSFVFIDDKEKINTNQNLGIWSLNISDENGVFSAPFEMTYEFSTPIKYTPLTLTFESIVKSLDVIYYLDNVEQHTTSIENNSGLIVTIEESNSQLSFTFNKLVISVKSTLEPYRFVKFNELDLGIYEIFGKEEIKDLKIIDEISIDSSAMVTNSCLLSILDKNGKYDILNPFNKLRTLQEKQEITIYHYLKVGDYYKELPLGTFLIKDMNYQGKELKLMCYDDRYFMNKIYYGSKFYRNKKVTAVLKDLFDYFNYDEKKYIIDNELSKDVVSGYIPLVTFGEALRLICESVCAIVTKNRSGVTYIYKTHDNSVKLFKSNEFYKSNPQKNLYNNIIDVNEYSYKEQSEKVNLYNGVLPKGVHLITFDKYPIVYTNYKDNYELLKQDNTNTNYAILNLYASGCEVEVFADDTQVYLQGKVYSTNVSTKRIKKYEYLEVDNYAITKVDNQLVTSSNSKNVAMWKLNRQEIKYNFDTKLLPYLEVGDSCKIQIPYQNLKKQNIYKDFVITKSTFGLSVKQTIEGE